MAQALFSQFNLPAEGQLRLQDSLSKLKAFSSFGNLIWFGIGVKHIVRSLAETEQGACCTAICACLSVCYKTEFSARVLKEFCDSSNIPRSLTPALSQWATLVDVCAGSVEASGFPLLVEGLSRLFSPRRDGHYAFETVTSPQAFAAALVELGKLSKGNLRSVTIRGGVDCACLAAIAEWLLALRIEIRDLSGSCLYQSGARDIEDPQVTFLILSEAIPIQDQLLTTTYRVCDVRSGKLEFNADTKQLYFSSGRSAWSNVLHNAFGTIIDKLTDQNCLLSFAQILCDTLRPCIQGNDSFANLNPWDDPATMKESDAQQTLLRFATRRFPELAKLNDVPMYKLRYNMLDSGTPRSRLRDECGCRYCKLRYSDHEAQVSSENVSSLCLCRCAAAICEFLWILSWLDLDDTITPSSTGFLMLYAAQVKRIDAKLESRYRSLGLLTYVGAHSTDVLFDKLKVSLWDGFSLSSILQLFTGVPVSTAHALEEQSAVCGNGICVYLPSLEDPSLGIVEQLRIRVVAGQIRYNHAPFKVICDMDSSYDHRSPSIGPLQMGANNPDSFVDFVILIAKSQLVFRMVIGETLDSSQLDVSYSISALSSHRHIDELTGYFPRRLQRLLVSKIRESNCTGEAIRITETAAPESADIWSGKCSISTLDQWLAYNPIRPHMTIADGWTMGITSKDRLEYYCLKGTPSLYYWLLLVSEHMPESCPYNYFTYFVHTSTCWRCCTKIPNNESQTTLAQQQLMWSDRSPLKFVDCDHPEMMYYHLFSNSSFLDRHDQRAFPTPNVQVAEASAVPFDNTSQHITNYRHLAGIGETESLDPGIAFGERREPISTNFLTERSRKLA
ncbi:hypothetical protein MMC15_007034 [Xylographa vitiligo]|nr:hypothetical protein [Xylographa vitiligo]